MVYQSSLKNIDSKVKEWTSSITILSEIAVFSPHAAYSAQTHGLSSKWSYLCRVTPNIGHLLNPLDIAKLLPTLTGRPIPNDHECALFALLAQHGGLGIRIPSKSTERELYSSLQVTSSLIAKILEQNQQYALTISCRAEPPLED